MADLTMNLTSASRRSAAAGWHGDSMPLALDDGFQHYSIVYPTKKLGVLLMSNSDNAKSSFGHLLALTIADTFTTLEWELRTIGPRAITLRK